MSGPINLNQARKARARAEKRKTGDVNAAKFGRTKAQRAEEDAARVRAETHLDGHKRDET